MIMTIIFGVSCQVRGGTSDYDLITEELGFVKIDGKNVIELGTELDITKLKLENKLSSGGNYTGNITSNVTPDMVTGDYSTDTVGERKIFITVGEEELELVFYVRYGVKFMVGDEVVSQQYLSEDEAPEIPDVEYLAPKGQYFVGWSPEVPEVISDNSVFTATFADEIKPPSLKTLSATYGQTLSELTLPSNKQGAWKFVDDGKTTVGDVGRNEFDVEFLPNAGGAAIESATVTIKVSKAMIQFDDLATEFVYDGTRKYPTYTVPDGVKVVEMGDRGTEVGSYDFTLLVNSDNYDGFHVGQYTISKATTTITLPDYIKSFDEVKFFDPSEYTVAEGFDKALLGEITLSKPNIGGAGEYQIAVDYDNTKNVSVTVVGGKITVTQSSLDSDDLKPDDVSATFGDKLGDIALSEHGSGTWSWKNPELLIDTAKELRRG